MPKLAIIGYCQAVALLNALGTWREALRSASDVVMADVEAPSGWEDLNTQGKLFALRTSDEFRVFEGSQFSLLNSSTFPVAEFETEVDEGGRPIKPSQALAAFIEKAAPFDAVVSLVNGSELYNFYTRANVPEFDFFPYDDDDGTVRQPIDAMYMAHRARQRVAFVEASLTYMRRALPQHRIIHVAPPPPLDGFPSFPMRLTIQLKWYQETVARLRQITADLSIDLIERPQAAVTEAGFLRTDYADGYTRGNADYGCLLAQEIKERLGGAPPPRKRAFWPMDAWKIPALKRLRTAS